MAIWPSATTSRYFLIPVSGERVERRAADRIGEASEPECAIYRRTSLTFVEAHGVFVEDGHGE